MALRSLQEKPNFRRCPKPNYPAGQLHDAECNTVTRFSRLTVVGLMVTCFDCKYNACFHCSAEWTVDHTFICPGVQRPVLSNDSIPEISGIPSQLIPRAVPNEGTISQNRTAGFVSDQIQDFSISDQTSGQRLRINKANPDRAEDDDPERPDDSTVLKDGMDAKVGDKSEIAGVVVIVDDQGWKQKIVVSYDLTVRSYAALGSDCENRVFSFVEMPRLEVSIPRSTYQNSFRNPQFRIHQTTIQMGPSVDQISKEEQTDDYTDSWTAKGQHPHHSTYAPIQKSVSSARSLGGSVEISAMPKATVQAGTTRGYLNEFPPQAAGIDLDRSTIETTGEGGFEWKYVFSKDSLLHTRFRLLEPHRGEVSVSNFFPSSIAATVSTILQTTQSPTRSFKKYCGIFIGYRHIKVVVHTDVMWNKETYAQFPHKRLPGGHQMNIKQQFRGPPGRWTVPPKRTFANDGQLETELSLGPIEGDTSPQKVNFLGALLKRSGGS